MDTKADELAKEAIVLRLFRLYRSLDGKATRALTEAYLDPIRDCLLSAIQQAFERFQDDEVEGADPAWPINVPMWVSQVKMLDRILNRVQRTDDGLVVYRMGELPPPGKEPLGPILLEVNGIPRDVSHLTLAEKELVLRTSQMSPQPEAEQIEGRKIPIPQLKRV